MRCPSEQVPYPNASEVMIHEEALYQVYVPLASKSPHGGPKLKGSVKEPNC